MTPTAVANLEIPRLTRKLNKTPHKTQYHPINPKPPFPPILFTSSPAYQAKKKIMAAMQKRLEREYHAMRKNPTLAYHVQLKQGEFSDWLGSLQGLKNSAYQGGTFKFHLHFTEEYPAKPPTLRFTTRIYHPNVDARTGAVAWRMLGSGWHHNITVEKVMMSLRTLLDHPELESAVEMQIAREFIQQPKRYVHHAKQWT
ncbi:hypothetical protein ACJBU6_01416 [Exserohilum turcicum]